MKVRPVWLLRAGMVLVLILASLLALLVLDHRPSVHNDGGQPAVELGAQDGRSARQQGAFAETQALPTGDVIVRRNSAQDVSAEAANVLSSYADQGRCVLVRAGFLDLYGRVWGCVVQGDGWSEVVVVSAGADDMGSEVNVVRMDAGTWEQRFTAEVGGEAGAP